MTPENKIAEILDNGFAMTLSDAADLDYYTTQIAWEDACRVLDAARLIITDPIYTGDIPFDYFDGEDKES